MNGEMTQGAAKQQIQQYSSHMREARGHLVCDLGQQFYPQFPHLNQMRSIRLPSAMSVKLGVARAYPRACLAHESAPRKISFTRGPGAVCAGHGRGFFELVVCWVS